MLQQRPDRTFDKNRLQASRQSRHGDTATPRRTAEPPHTPDTVRNRPRHGANTLADRILPNPRHCIARRSRHSRQTRTPAQEKESADRRHRQRQHIRNRTGQTQRFLRHEQISRHHRRHEQRRNERDHEILAPSRQINRHRPQRNRPQNLVTPGEITPDHIEIDKQQHKPRGEKRQRHQKPSLFLDSIRLL